MNTQLSEGIKVWKAGEFARFVQREIDRDHNPDSPANRWQRARNARHPWLWSTTEGREFSWRQFIYSWASIRRFGMTCFDDRARDMRPLVAESSKHTWTPRGRLRVVG